MDAEQNEQVESLKQQIKAIESELKAHNQKEFELFSKAEEIQRQIRKAKMRLIWLLDERDDLVNRYKDKQFPRPKQKYESWKAEVEQNIKNAETEWQELIDSRDRLFVEMKENRLQIQRAETNKEYLLERQSKDILVKYYDTLSKTGRIAPAPDLNKLEDSLKRLRYEDGEKALSLFGDAADIIDHHPIDRNYARWVRYFLVALDDESEVTLENLEMLKEYIRFD